MNGLGKTANRAAGIVNTGGKSRSIFEAIQNGSTASIYEMVRDSNGSGSIYEEIRTARQQAGAGGKKGSSLLQKDWKKK